MNERKELLFVSPRFLFPVDSGGKIRTTQILRGMKGGRFRIHLVSPATPKLASRYSGELREVCDEFSFWSQADGIGRKLQRIAFLLDELPMPVRSDASAAARNHVREVVARGPEVAVFDFLHTAPLVPPAIACPTLLFTHNIEAEIFARHIEVARSPVMRAVWRSQYRKMLEFERASIHRFDVAVAVSDRDARKFASEYGAVKPFVIPTGVDLEYFSYSDPARSREVVFCGSMDWLANQDGVRFFMDEIWPRVIKHVPDARMTVVGRAPPAAMVEAARRRGYGWSFTGFVDDVRPIVSGAAVSVVPLRVGGGTRLKIFESMAMGPVVISTRIGVEGLPVNSGEHCLVADEPDSMAQAISAILLDPQKRMEISNAARRYVEDHFSYRIAAAEFERACALAITRFSERKRQ